MKVRPIPCEIRGVPIRSGAGEGVNVTVGKQTFCIDLGEAANVMPTEQIEKVWQSPRCSVTAYNFRGGLTCLADRDLAFVVAAGAGCVNCIEFSVGTVLDFTEVSCKVGFEISEPATLLKIEFTEKL